MINFSDTENISKLIDLEKAFLTSTLSIQQNLNKQILIFMKKFMDGMNILSDTLSPDDKSFFYLNEATNILNRSNSNIGSLTGLIENLENLNNLHDNLEDEIHNYNITFKEVCDSVFSNTEIIEIFIYEININGTSENSSDSDSENVVIPESQMRLIKNNPCSSSNSPRRTLIISETQQRVILPYDINTVSEILKNNPNLYTSIQDVINQLYTKPISHYRFSAISRFKEAFKLVKYKEKGSLLKALGLAFELLGNYSLHPAIITACSSLDELDIYLACLEDNTLNDFKFFDIKYEIPLASSKFAKDNI